MPLPHPRFLRLGLPAAILSSVLLTSLACNSSNPNGGLAADGTCPKNELEVLFSPMYSAYDGVHTFQVPAIVNGAPDQTAITWSTTDKSVVKIEQDPTTGGAMLTTLKAGTTNIVAVEGSLCGSSPLTVTSATADDWNTGSERYNDGIVLRPPARGPDAGTSADAGTPQQAACTNCHGSGATSGPFKDIAHTPEQTGGFSDADLISIFTLGQVPDGGYFDSTIISQSQWSQIHHWDMTDDEASGMVVYLRSLTPAPQDGTSNFGGRFHGDGGFPHRDGGAAAGGGM